MPAATRGRVAGMSGIYGSTGNESLLGSIWYDVCDNIVQDVVTREEETYERRETDACYPGC